MTAARDPLEPTITDLSPASPAAYYDQQLQLRQGVSLDLSWRLHHFNEIQKLVALFDHEPAVWIVLPMNTAKAWHITALLDAERGSTYRASLVNLLFYRFDQNADSNLVFRLSDLLRYDSGPGADTQFDVQSGDELCADFTFTALAPVDGLYSAGLHIVDLTGTISVAQLDEGLGSHNAGDVIHFSPC
ncbi:MAG TPA: hypothetical protein VHO69_19555, partial [Phototrophicaceae bacterium]|nr:hypothetical protein [Phototrophicaceae bacterium]